MSRPPPRSTLFPYTTLFRSGSTAGCAAGSRSAASATGLGRLADQAGFDLDAFDRRVALHAGNERSEEHTSELQSLAYLVCRLLLEKKKYPVTRTWTLRTLPIQRPCRELRFFFHVAATAEIYTLSLHDALPIWVHSRVRRRLPFRSFRHWTGPPRRPGGFRSRRFRSPRSPACGQREIGRAHV